MNRIIILGLLSSVFLLSCSASECVMSGNGTASDGFTGNVVYDEYFTPQRLRVDLVLSGNSETQSAWLDGLHKEQAWSGAPENLIDPFGYGQYFYEVFDGENLIFSKGFSTLFEEWRTTDEARNVSKAATQSVWMPFPKDTVHFVLYQRVRQTGRFESMLEFDIDPTDRHIVPAPENDFKVTCITGSGEDYLHKVDIVAVAEGYTQDQMAKFRADATRMVESFFIHEPYKSRREDFNIWLVESVSAENGVDIPQDGVWKGTVLDSMFDTFYEDRYLTVWDHKKLASAVSNVPFDAIVVVANETKYGGGGIYNSYALGSSDNSYSDVVLVHEFGHSFAGLGDEYYTSSVAYEDYYPAGVEPWEPNVTTLVDFDSKWADLVEDGTPVPTPDDPDAWYGKVGVFEGAGYVAKGCYRPFYECRMMNNTAPGFCPVCQRAIGHMIDWYVK